uniref:NADH dehydrogenase subunit 6 n=1 Tax=Spirobranchus giganteus TaxID=1914524 RepID=A0A1I9WKB4_9ANNE|nr:NADH dehydrogenase subunit 6 [Spirobranchus giganteus]APA32609.1 NADH dehydrogenase subunit 6 [Spirobranchus giganteus]
MESVLDILLIGSVTLAVGSGVEPESVGATTALVAVSTVFSVGYDSSSLFGCILCLSYLSALLILFLFFVSLAPESLDDSDMFSESQRKVFVASVGILSGVCDFFSGVEDEVEMNVYSLSSIGVLFFSLLAWYLFLLACYLFLAVVVIAKLSKRKGGALRSVSPA